MLSLVVDTNVLFSYFCEGSFTKELLPQLWLYAPERAFSEIEKHESLLREKNSLSKAEFNKLLASLAEQVIVIGVSEYTSSLKACGKIPDKDDIAFVALAVSLDVPLWTNDKRLLHKDLLVVPTEVLVKVLARGEPWLFGSDEDRKFLAKVAKTAVFKADAKKAAEAVRLAHRKAFG